MSKTVTIFGSSSPEPGSPAYEQAEVLGQTIAEAGLTVCNGGYGGTMEAAARGARKAGGHTIGITLRSVRSGRANEWIENSVPCADLMERIETLMKRGDAYAVLPGGTGTLAEVGILLEFLNKGLMARKPAVFIGEFWEPILDMFAEELSVRREGSSPLEGTERYGLVAHAGSPVAAGQFLRAELS